MVGIPDINEDFLGVLQVINGNSIETSPEFLEEEVFHKQQEDFHQPKDEARGPEQTALPAARSREAWGEEQPGQQRQGKPDSNINVAMETAQKCKHAIAAGQMRWRKRQKQHQSQNKPDCHQ
jgi:hypothetical protein